MLNRLPFDLVDDVEGSLLTDVAGGCGWLTGVVVTEVEGSCWSSEVAGGCITDVIQK